MSEQFNSGAAYGLAQTLNDWLSADEMMGGKAPLPEEITKKIIEHLNEFGLVFVHESDLEKQIRETKTPAILKSPGDKVSKRMRELAGIPGKGTFV